MTYRVSFDIPAPRRYDDESDEEYARLVKNYTKQKAESIHKLLRVMGVSNVQWEGE